MTTALTALTRIPLIQDLEALYQRLYGTPERMRRTDRFLAKVIVAMIFISAFQTLANHAACGAGSL